MAKWRYRGRLSPTVEKLKGKGGFGGQQQPVVLNTTEDDQDVVVATYDNPPQTQTASPITTWTLWIPDAPLAHPTVITCETDLVVGPVATVRFKDEDTHDVTKGWLACPWMMVGGKLQTEGRHLDYFR
jgi:hypothetical protein